MATQLKGFRQTIEGYLAAMAQKDPLFADCFCNPNKNIGDCITYILNQVKDSGLQGFDDDEIYALAVHYYVEEDVKPGTPVQCQVIVNHQVQLTEEEIAEQRQRAKEEVFRKETTRLRNTGRITPAPKPEEEEEPEELLLFS